MYQPHPFHWIPAQGERHASRDPYPGGVQGYPDGATVSTLCGQDVTADSGAVAWLWDTCQRCNDAAHVLAEGAAV